jgi:hypothetical protein
MKRRNGYPARGVGASVPKPKAYSRMAPLRGMLDSASEGARAPTDEGMS